MKIWIKLMTALGFPPVAGVVLAALITSKTPLNLTELSRRTGYAKSHLSQTLKLMHARNVVESYVEKKKKYYVLNMKGLLKELEQHIDNILDSLHHLSNNTNEIEFAEFYEKLSRKFKV
ncbi:MAG: MarR family transcriptional regulator [Thermosphaera sp.]